MPFDLIQTNSVKRHLATLLHSRPAHHQHRRDASVGPITSPSRYGPLIGLDISTSEPLAQPRLREEDECPICHHALPPKGPDGSEIEREAHVTACIETHFSSSGPRPSYPPPSEATEAAIVASAATSMQTSGGRAVPSGHRARTGPFDMPSSSLQQRRKAAGMLVYHASVKDCVGEDEEAGQECVICFEEFAVGDEMGRLECLCKFHKVREYDDFLQLQMWREMES